MGCDAGELGDILARAIAGSDGYGQATDDAGVETGGEGRLRRGGSRGGGGGGGRRGLGLRNECV